MGRYQVIDKSGTSYGTFAKKSLAHQFINNTYPSYKELVKKDGNLREITIVKVLPEILMIMPVKTPKPKPKTDWELLIELTMASGEDTEEIKALRKKLLNKSNVETKSGLKERRTGISVLAKTTNGILRFLSYQLAGDYYGVTSSAISRRVTQGTASTRGKLKGVIFYIEENDYGI